LQATDPEGTQVSYTISGDHFSVNSATGVVKLREKLDREERETLSVVLTVQDEGGVNLIPFRREIRGEICCQRIY